MCIIYEITLFYTLLCYSECCTIILIIHHHHYYIGTFGKELTPAIVGDKGAPAVVLKCIEAVEARGLQTEGIYRVSPSHIQRKQLKEALDRGDAYLYAQ